MTGNPYKSEAWKEIYDINNIRRLNQYINQEPTRCIELIFSPKIQWPMKYNKDIEHFSQEEFHRWGIKSIIMIWKTIKENQEKWKHSYDKTK